MGNRASATPVVAIPSHAKQTSSYKAAHDGIIAPAPIHGLEDYITTGQITDHIRESLRYRWIEILTLRSWAQVLKPIPAINYSEPTPVFWSIQHNRSKFLDHRLIYRIAGPIRFPSSITETMTLVDNLLADPSLVARGIAIVRQHGHPLHRTCIPDGGVSEKFADELKTFRVVVINNDKERSSSAAVAHRTGRRDKRHRASARKGKTATTSSSASLAASSSGDKKEAALATLKSIQTAVEWAETKKKTAAATPTAYESKSVKDAAARAQTLFDSLSDIVAKHDHAAAQREYDAQPSSKKKAGPFAPPLSSVNMEKLQAMATRLQTENVDPRTIVPLYTIDTTPPPIVLPWSGEASNREVAANHRQADKRQRRKAAVLNRLVSLGATPTEVDDLHESKHFGGDGDEPGSGASSSGYVGPKDSGNRSYSNDPNAAIAGLADLPPTSINVSSGTYEWLQRVPTSAFASKIGAQIAKQTGWTASINMDDWKHTPPNDRTEWVVYIEGEYISVGVTLVCQSETDFTRDFFYLARLNEEPDLLAKGAKLMGSTSHPRYERAWWELHRNMMLSQRLQTSNHHLQHMVSENVVYGSLSDALSTMTNNERATIVSFGLDRLVERLNLTPLPPNLAQSTNQKQKSGGHTIWSTVSPSVAWPTLLFDAVDLNESHVLAVLTKRLKLDAAHIGRLLVRSFRAGHIDCAYELLRYVFACPFMIDGLFCWDANNTRQTYNYRYRYMGVYGDVYNTGSAVALPKLLEAAVLGGDLSCFALALDLAYFVLRTSYFSNNSGRVLEALGKAWQTASAAAAAPAPAKSSSKKSASSKNSNESKDTVSSLSRAPSASVPLSPATANAMLALLSRIEVPYGGLHAVTPQRITVICNTYADLSVYMPPIHRAFHSVGSFYDEGRTARSNQLRAVLLDVAGSVASRDTLSLICDYMLGGLPFPRLFPPTVTATAMIPTASATAIPLVVATPSS